MSTLRSSSLKKVNCLRLHVFCYCNHKISYYFLSSPSPSDILSFSHISTLHMLFYQLYNQNNNVTAETHYFNLFVILFRCQKPLQNWLECRCGFAIKITLFVPNNKMSFNHFWAYVIHYTRTKYDHITFAIILIAINLIGIRFAALKCFSHMIYFPSKSRDCGIRFK